MPVIISLPWKLRSAWCIIILKNTLGYLNMGLIFNAIGDKPHARQFYLKVIALDPDNGDAYFNFRIFE